MKPIVQLIVCLFWLVIPAHAQEIPNKTFEDTWGALKKRYCVTPENLATDGKIEVIAAQKFPVSQFGISHRLVIYFRNVSDRPIKVPTRNGHEDNFTQVHEQADGTGVAGFYVTSTSYMSEYPVKSNLDKFGWLELQPGEVGQSSELGSSEGPSDRKNFGKFRSVKVHIEVDLVGENGNLWHGRLSVLAGNGSGKPGGQAAKEEKKNTE